MSLAFISQPVTEFIPALCLHVQTAQNEQTFSFAASVGLILIFPEQFYTLLKTKHIKLYLNTTNTMSNAARQ